MKAAREAGRRTTLAAPGRRLRGRAARRWSTGSTTTRRCTDELTDFAAAITPPGWSNSLGQKLVQLTMPGVPDIYQGTELWDNSLVDPDNRRPVDFGAPPRAAGPHRRRLAAAGRRRPARRSCW